MVNISELKIHYVERARHRDYGENELPRDAPQTLYGYNEVYQIDGLWFGYEESDGGSYRSVGYPTREEAEGQLQENADSARQFWDEKVQWLRNGDRTSTGKTSRGFRTAGSHGAGDSRQVIRCKGNHYTVGYEPSEAELRGSRSWLGHGGALFTFRLLSGEVIHSHNVWYQGRIPIEYRELLSDNAVPITRVVVS